MFGQNEAAMSEGEGAEEIERDQKKRGLRGGREAGGAAEGNRRLKGLRRFRRQECIGAFSVHSDRVRVRVASDLSTPMTRSCCRLPSHLVLTFHSLFCPPCSNCCSLRSFNTISSRVKMAAPSLHHVGMCSATSACRQQQCTTRAAMHHNEASHAS